MSLTVDEINQIQFNTKMRGYNPTEVKSDRSHVVL